MAYDNNGNWYFDPAIDLDDKEMLDSEIKREHARGFMQYQKNLQQDTKVIGDTWAEALKSEGLDPQAYAELVNQDPQLAKELLAAGMKNLVSGVKKGQGKKSEPVGRKEQSLRAPQADTTQALAKAKEKQASGKRLTEEELLDILPGLLL